MGGNSRTSSLFACTLLLLSGMLSSCAFRLISRDGTSHSRSLAVEGGFRKRIPDDIEEAQKYLLRSEQKRAVSIEKKAEARKLRAQHPTVELESSPRAPFNVAKQTIFGQNIIECREFSIEGVKNFEFIGGFTCPKSAPVLGLPEVAFIGRSNVGKSSLLNSLTSMNKKLAITSKTPGRTQLINMFKCSDKGGDIALFVDLPGYGFAKLSRNRQSSISKFLREYFENRGSLRLVVLLVDPRLEAQGLDLGMLQFLQMEQVPHVVVATKIDKISKSNLEENLIVLSSGLGIQQDSILPFSSVTGEGRRALWKIIHDGILGTLDVDYGDDPGLNDNAVEEEDGEGEDGTDIPGTEHLWVNDER
jgi:GTP-binding protein